MLVTAAPCAIKGAAFDCLRGCHQEERDIHRETNGREEEALPLLALVARVRPTWGSTICVPALLISSYLPSSTLHRRLSSGCNADIIVHLSLLIDAPSN